MLNDLMLELLTLQEDDHVLEIGFGTGKLINEMAKQAHQGLIEGIDFSSTMVDLAKKRNRHSIAQGRVKLVSGDFEQVGYRDNDFDKVCSANTIYFWSNVRETLGKIERILRPKGKLIVGFEDRTQLAERQLNPRVFRLYNEKDVAQFLKEAGFSNVEIESKERNSTSFIVSWESNEGRTI